MIEDCIPFLVGNLSEPTKHFSEGTKVYCFPPRWGDGCERITIIGRHIKSNRFIQIVLPSKKIKNWRLKQIYSPTLIKKIMSLNIRRWESEAEILQQIRNRK